MVRRNVLVAVLALVAIAASVPPAAADGLYLRLATESPSVEPEQALKVQLTAVGTKTVVLPAVPVFLVDAGQGAAPHDGVTRPAGEEATSIVVSPDRAHKGSFELALPGPGTYRIRAQYRVGNRVIRSNALKVEVLGGPQVGRRD